MRLFISLVVICLVPVSALAERPLAFHLRFDPKLHARPFTGRVYVMLCKADQKTLQRWPSWFNTEPCFARDVKDWKPGATIILDKSSISYPVTLDRIDKRTWTIQAVMDVHPNHIHFSTAPGNLYTIARKELDPNRTGPVELTLDRVFEPRPFKETDRVKWVEIDSKRLSAFHGRTTKMRAGIILPASYGKNPAKRYPVVYEIPGFSGTYHTALTMVDRGVTERAGVEVIHVVLDANCRHGHHVFADSANNGPVGKALIEELIPTIEKKFRAIGKPSGRLVSGHSSGGWSSLWLQVTYPDFFAGCWSTAPDPVDFRDFQRINIYRAGENMFTDAGGMKRPIARRGTTPMLWYKGFSDMEEVMGHGGQLASFEGVFSDRGADGQPKRLWNRKTGAIDPEVARSWEKYDIRLVLERNWPTLGPKLKGKIHVYMGDLDSFYLEGATALLKESLAKLKSDAVVELFPGKNHGTLMDSAMRKRIAREMATTLRANKVVE
jgi:hypothetical protein